MSYRRQVGQHAAGVLDQVVIVEQVSEIGDRPARVARRDRKYRRHRVGEALDSQRGIEEQGAEIGRGHQVLKVAVGARDVLELVLQLLFTSASPNLATYDDRRASLWRYLSINESITCGIIVAGAMLAMSAHVLVLSRLAATARVGLDRKQRLNLIINVPLLTVMGTLCLLATSQGILWDLKQSGWNIGGYVRLCWDRLLMHGVAIMCLCTVTMIVLYWRQSRGSTHIILGSLPALATLLLGYVLYK